jgi:hypothetical protein
MSVFNRAGSLSKAIEKGRINCYSLDDLKDDISSGVDHLLNLDESVENLTDSLGDSVSGVWDDITGQTAADEAAANSRNLAEANARFIGLESTEMDRRATKQFENDKAMVKGAMASSGILTDTGTSELFLDEMTKSFKKEMDWNKVSKESRQEIAIKGGGIAADQIQSQQKQNETGTALTVMSFFL